MVFSLEIAEEGVAGVRLGANGAVSFISYKTGSDGRIIFSTPEWKTFVECHHECLEVGQSILLTGRTTSNRNIEIMFVIDIILYDDYSLMWRCKLC